MAQHVLLFHMPCAVYRHEMILPLIAFSHALYLMAHAATSRRHSQEDAELLCLFMSAVDILALMMAALYTRSTESAPCRLFLQQHMPSSCYHDRATFLQEHMPRTSASLAYCFEFIKKMSFILYTAIVAGVIWSR